MELRVQILCTLYHLDYYKWFVLISVKSEWVQLLSLIVLLQSLQFFSFFIKILQLKKSEKIL